MPEDVVDGSKITGWHAHIYFDGDSRDAAWQLRETIKKHIGDKVAIGHFHEASPSSCTSTCITFFTGILACRGPLVRIPNGPISYT